jgi:hypothetical protein
VTGYMWSKLNQYPEGIPVMEGLQRVTAFLGLAVTIILPKLLFSCKDNHTQQYMLHKQAVSDIRTRTLCHPWLLTIVGSGSVDDTAMITKALMDIVSDCVAALGDEHFRVMETIVVHLLVLEILNPEGTVLCDLLGADWTTPEGKAVITRQRFIKPGAIPCRTPKLVWHTDFIFLRLGKYYLAGGTDAINPYGGCPR